MDSFKIILLILFVMLSDNSKAQNENSLPFQTIPEAPSVFNEATVVVRMIEGLGFRYFWATEGLKEEDLTFNPGNDARNIIETVQHTYNLSNVILNAVSKQINQNSSNEHMDFESLRKKTLDNLEKSVKILGENSTVEEFQIVFDRGGSTSSFPFWNLINGPIEDAVWHCGQIVTLRRLSGNPINPKVNVFLGKLNN